jgi:phospholipase C
MPFELEHTLFSKFIKPKVRASGEQAFVEVDEQGSFPVLFAGRVSRGARAEFNYRVRAAVPEPVTPIGEPVPAPLHGGFETQHKTIPLTLRVFTPDGQEFIAPQISVADLQKFRDPRGGPSAPWSYRLTGQGETLFVDADTRILNPRGTVRIGVTETIASESAPPLVNNVALSTGIQTFRFDLYREGTFVADVRALLAPWRGRMRLIDPDGVVAAETDRQTLSFKVNLRTLNKSRSAGGGVRPWTLEVTRLGGTFLDRPRLSATVIGEGRVELAALRTRIDTLLGHRGEFFEIFGQNQGGEALIRLKITDVVSAETIDIHNLLESVVEGIDPDKGIEADTVYTLARIPEQQDFGTRLNVSSLRVDSIDLELGPGVKLGAAVPAVRLTITVSGKATIHFGPVTIADVEVPGGKIEIEAGIRVAPDGTPQTVASVPDTLFEGGVRTGVAGALIALGPLGAALAIGIDDKVAGIVKDRFNDPMVEGLRKAIENPLVAPSILMMIFGAHLTYRPFKIEGGVLFFDHIAPLEPEPKPRPAYHAAIGRSFTILGPNAIRFNPPLLPDTWKADNLAKIDHVVVVMMENRSYDHVLGYRAQLGDNADGLSQDVIDAIERTPKDPKAPGGLFKVRRLREAGFDANALGLMTRLPTSVGHAFKDVEQQLRFQVDGPGGRKINSPKGFVDNYLPRLKPRPGQTPTKVVPNDVLGFYDEKDLPFFDFLAANYAYSDRYYSSHPGPTLPNRMYSLTGDLQYDRYDFPIVENNNSDNFLLSRVPTIFDLLFRKGVSFRVYESDPSVTMLRMFVRYATDTTNILPLDRFFADAAAGQLPSFAMVEPRMHSHPQDDDHPDADMYRGQIFLKGVYDALRNSDKWEKTLLIVTYDEHGGLYDHRVPPVAELMGEELVLNPGPGIPPAGPPVLFSPTNLGVMLPTEVAPAPALPTQSPLLPIRYGVRVPTFVISPWTMRGKGPSIVLDHCSILKTVLARFLGGEKPFLSDRVSASHSFDAFLTEPAPRLDVPPSPDLEEDLREAERIGPSGRSEIITPTLSRQQMRRGPIEFHDLSGRWARQLGR